MLGENKHRYCNNLTIRIEIPQIVIGYTNTSVLIVTVVPSSPFMVSMIRRIHTQVILFDPDNGGQVE